MVGAGARERRFVRRASGRWKSLVGGRKLQLIVVEDVAVLVVGVTGLEASFGTAVTQGE